MARLFKPTVVRWNDPAGRRCQAGVPGAVAVKQHARKWYGRFTDRRGRLRTIPLSADKQAATRMLAKLQVDDELAVVNLKGRATQQPILALVEEWHDDLLTEGTSPRQAAQRRKQCRDVLDGLQWPDDIAFRDVKKRLAEMVTGGLAKITANNYGAAAKAFTAWLAREEVLIHDPLSPLKPIKGHRPTYSRRALEADECRLLVTVTRASRRIYRELTGEDRAALYLMALATGLRANELASLCGGMVDVERGIVWQLETKSGQRAEQPVAGDWRWLRDWLKGRARGVPLWPGSWRWQAGTMVALDAGEAGLPALTPAGRLDFHALLHTFVTLLVRAGIDAKTVQVMARHGDVATTLKYYTHTTDAAKLSAAKVLGGLLAG